MDTNLFFLAGQLISTHHLCRGWKSVQPVLIVLFQIALLGIAGGKGEAAATHSDRPGDGLPEPQHSEFNGGIDPAITPDAIIIMKDKNFQVVKGGKTREKVTDPHFSLMAGEYIWILLKNEDKVAHEFVSPLFRKVDLEFSGQASIIYTPTAAGVRVEPGQVVAIRFWLPEQLYDLFYFWCNVHGKHHQDQMRGEMFILESME